MDDDSQLSQTSERASEIKNSSANQCDLTDEQRNRIKRNLEKALELRKRKAQQAEIPKNVPSKWSKSTDTKPVDTGGGFLLDDEEIQLEKESSLNIVEKPPAFLYPHQPECLECGKNFGCSYLMENFAHNVCDSCRDPKEKHSLITKTEAKKQYILTDVDLEERGKPLKYIMGKNPHNPRWNNMKLYLLLQVEERAMEIWGSEEKLIEELEKRDENRFKSKLKAHQKKLKTLRMSMRSSLYTKDLSSTHNHEFGEEVYNEQDDTYTKQCVTCNFSRTYEKM